MNGNNARKEAIARIATTQPLNKAIDYVEDPLSDVFGRHVFSMRVMQERMPKTVFQKLKRTIDRNQPLDPGIADVVANAMKDWATERGATHYTHWFHPMTGLPAEKHDAFISVGSDGKVLSEFSGKMLIKGEPDASSFPSGGLRSTFEARGYTAWDPTSPAFLRESINGVTLCIPTAFYSYTGECLDRKTPLLRSIEAVSKHALRILRLFGNETVTHIHTTLGPEQEYFLIDKSLFLQRPDLINAGRTVYGGRPPKGQELEDHYFGSIRPRILAFMMDVEKRLYELGIPVKTRHNEVSPAQFEIAPAFEIANVATDHNVLVMDQLKAVAEEHGLVCLLHEKPFAGVNGSGKHNNWSICDSDGNNLLEPGDTPHENAQFLVFLAAVIAGVDDWAVPLRISVSTAGNDHRLGANEAPPAILSIFLGAQLTEVVENIISGSKKVGQHGGFMEVGVSTLPPLPKDATDRNRTSPFAFTGNKFEFRAVGSSHTMAPANIAINVGVAEALDHMATRLEEEVANGADFNSAVQALLQDVFSRHQKIIFNGDNYTEDWVREAEKRGLPNLRNSVDALKRFTDPRIVEVFSKHNVLSEREIVSRQEILLETYATSISIEAQLTADIGRTLILPAAIEYQKRIADSMISLKQALGEGVDLGAQRKILDAVTTNISGLKQTLTKLDEARTKADESESEALERASMYRDGVLPLMEKCREYGDNLEHYVDDASWPLPKYREMLWIY